MKNLQKGSGKIIIITIVVILIGIIGYFGVIKKTKLTDQQPVVTQENEINTSEFIQPVSSSTPKPIKVINVSLCLPQGVNLTDRIIDGVGNTVKERLDFLKATCVNNKIVSGTGKEIYFYRQTTCYGTPPPDYMEKQQAENEKINNLKLKYEVIVISCNYLLQ